MSSPDETHHGDEAAAQTAHGDSDASGHDDAHAGHAAAAEFIKEDSLQDKTLQLVACLVLAGLVYMIWIWWTAPIQYTPDEHAGAKVPPISSPAKPAEKGAQPQPAQ